MGKKVKASPDIVTDPKEIVLSGQARRYVACASGFAHASARDLDLLIAGLMIGLGNKGLIDKLIQEQEFLKQAVEALENAKMELAMQEAQVAGS